MGQKYLEYMQLNLTIIKRKYDIRQSPEDFAPIFSPLMLFSKSFGYSLRSILYVTIMNETKPRVQLVEIARQLGVPKHFLGKVLKKLVKEGVISSMKGPHGGFCINDQTLTTSLFSLVEATGEVEEFGNCVLRFRKCNMTNPCPMHLQIESLRQQWQDLLASTTIRDLLKKEQPDFIKSIVQED